MPRTYVGGVRLAVAFAAAALVLVGVLPTAALAAPSSPVTGPARGAKTLALADATVTQSGSISIYSWDETVGYHDWGAWTTEPVPGTVINGGLRLHRFAQVYLTDSYPASSNTWRIGVDNMEFSAEDLTIYAIALNKTDGASLRGPRSSTGATLTSAGDVKVYSWDYTIDPKDKKAWTTPVLPDQVVAGGMHVHDWMHVYMTDNYPVSNNQWRTGVESFDVRTTVTTYAITVTGANVSIGHWDSTITSMTNGNWTTPAMPGSIVSGGIWVHGFNDTRVLHMYPASAVKWAVASSNLESHDVNVTIYALSMQ